MSFLRVIQGGVEFTYPFDGSTQRGRVGNFTDSKRIPVVLSDGSGVWVTASSIRAVLPGVYCKEPNSSVE